MMSSHRRRSVEASPLALRSGQRFFFSLKGPQDSCDISTSDMLSDMQCNLAIHVTHILISDKKYGIYIVTFYLAHIHTYIYIQYIIICIYAYIPTIHLTFYLTYILTYCLTCYLTDLVTLLAYILTLLSAILSGMNISWHFICHLLWHFI